MRKRPFAWSRILGVLLAATSVALFTLGVAPYFEASAAPAPGVTVEASDASCTTAAIAAATGVPTYPLPARCVDRVDRSTLQTHVDRFARSRRSDTKFMLEWCDGLERWGAANRTWVETPSDCWRARIAQVVKQRGNSGLLTWLCSKLLDDHPEACLLAPEKDTVA